MFIDTLDSHDTLYHYAWVITRQWKKYCHSAAQKHIVFIEILIQCCHYAPVHFIGSCILFPLVVMWLHWWRYCYLAKYLWHDVALHLILQAYISTIDFIYIYQIQMRNKKNVFFYYCQTSNIRGILVDNKIVDHWNVFWASPVGAAPPTTSYST